MDLSASEIATTVISALEGLLRCSATEFAKRAGAEAFAGAMKLLPILRERFANDRPADARLVAFQDAPEAEREEFTRLLTEKVTADATLRASLLPIVEPLTPSIHLIQRIEKADRITGIAIGQMTEGRIDMEMDVQKAKDITGIKITRVGR